MHSDPPFKDSDAIAARLHQLAIELEQYVQQQQLPPITHLVGIQTGGLWVAKAMLAMLNNSRSPAMPDILLGSLNISFYRDDFSTRGLHPTLNASELPLPIDQQHIVLIDDVIMSGRTVRAALNGIFDYGRPALVTLLALVDMQRRALPIQADLVGFQTVLPNHQRIKLHGPDPMTLSIHTPSVIDTPPQ